MISSTIDFIYHPVYFALLISNKKFRVLKRTTSSNKENKKIMKKNKRVDDKILQFFILFSCKMRFSTIRQHQNARLSMLNSNTLKRI